MAEIGVFKQLQTALASYALLYVEDNRGLNAQATVLFKKIFSTVYTAYDGEAGLELFKKYHPAIVIADIEMPKMSGLAMSQAIIKIDPEAKIIITTAHDDFKLLHQSIQIGVFDYLLKPMRVETLVKTLARCSHILNEELHRKIFYANLHSIFNYQNSLTILLQGQKVVMANEPSLEFFAVASVEMLRKAFVSFGTMLLKHNGFLYDHEGREWYSEISANPGKLFNIKLAGSDGENHHFILRFQSIPDKEGYGVLSLNDVTELGLLKLYDASAVEQERLLKDEKMVRGLLDMVVRSGAKIRVHNLYKGLSITNDALITTLTDKEAVLQTPYVQLKAIQYEEEFYLTSELFPTTILCSGIERLDFDAQCVHFSHYRMVQTSPTRRAAIRVIPDQSLTITLLYEGRKYEADVVIMDISINAVRLQLPTLPSGFGLKQTVVLDIVLETAPRPTIINTSAEVYRIQENQRRYEVVCMYTLHGQAQKNLIDYIAKRQMVLIREFKGMQYEK
ncbi:MAG: response regulator [Sulfuricurvum sp.]|uniref:response regulator n=1 Tax=Sulfuricurvum sp. TaxID=2025608 RepID=UPI002639B5C4|nr:response regulator [Sulfuricurvum sp.]MDD5161170.1 response regulator [Sulfuricurvum sp.]